MSEFQYTTAIDKIRSLTKPIRVIQGGTWAGKTQGIIADYIDRCTKNPWMDVTVTAESIPVLKKGAIKFFESTLRAAGDWIESNYNRTERVYSFSNGAKMAFESFDSVGKADASGKRTHLFVNEAQYTPFPIVESLMIRTSHETTFDFNPTYPFYVHEEILGDDDVDHLILTYQDNETTPEKIKKDFRKKIEKAFYNPEESWKSDKNVKSKTHANWCRVYITGELGSQEGLIFVEGENWHIVSDDILVKAGHVGNGIDFGFVHPCAFIEGYLIDDKRIFKEVFSISGLRNPQIADLIKERGDSDIMTYADSANPQNISELDAYGIKIKGATKGPGSVDFGIGILQEEPFYVTESSLNLIKGLRNYRYKETKDGSYYPEPVKFMDDEIDAMRYLAMETMSEANKPSTPVFTFSPY